MEATEMFNILDSTDSTNNYAMALVHEGLAKHGMAWFARHQTAGRGQQGKRWETVPGENIAISIALQPGRAFFQNQFFFNAVIANTCYDFFKKHAGTDVSIKWPNDIYWRDRKAGGLLIENKLMGNIWKWAIVGIGININQTEFDPLLPNPVSLKQITGKHYEPVELARDLHEMLLKNTGVVSENDIPAILDHYNSHLYKKGELVRFKKGAVVFESRVKEVNRSGKLVTEDSMEREFAFNEIEWLKPVEN
ncbi:MAG: biotin--[acetyl-CoA-carboxylase] ligase [Bacteroidetes bacterium]|nr:biotin--[acetyl-CoA-carboxylase] ligase [Bacteroidota bacterium]